MSESETRPRLVDATTDTSEFDSADIDLRNEVKNLRWELSQTQDRLADSMSTTSLLKKEINMLEAQLQFAPKHGMGGIADPSITVGGHRSFHSSDTAQDEIRSPDTYVVSQPGVARDLGVQGAEKSIATTDTGSRSRFETHHVLPPLSRDGRNMHFDANVDGDRIVQHPVQQHQEGVGLRAWERCMREKNVSMNISPVSTAHIRNTRHMSAPGAFYRPTSRDFDNAHAGSCLAYGKGREVRSNTIPYREERAFSAGEVRPFWGEQEFAEHAAPCEDRRRTFSDGMKYAVHRRVDAGPNPNFSPRAGSPVSFGPPNAYMHESNSFERKRDMYAGDRTSCGGVRQGLHTLPSHLIRPEPLTPNICRDFYFGGECSYGNRCWHKHVESPYPQVVYQSDVRPKGSVPPVYEHICIELFQAGKCSYGNRCRFVHPHNIEALRRDNYRLLVKRR